MRTAIALMITAPASGQGKTTVTAALARWFYGQGKVVQVFKTGPDYLDPMILERASHNPVYQLDLWMGGEDHCRQLIYQAAETADVILIEGVMGMFDGTPSSADLAQMFGIPILAVIDGRSMAQTFGALAHGLATYRPDLPFAGVFANRVASAGHYQMLAESLTGETRILGRLAPDPEIALPERHLGLVQGAEIDDLEARIDRAAAALEDMDISCLPEVTFTAPEPASIPALLTGTTIAVAKDAAFSFLYRANLDLLTAMGAELEFFSPLKDAQLPMADALYLPGGYPELHLAALSENRAMKVAITAHHQAQKPILAECGGMMYLLRTLTDKQGEQAEMVGLLPGDAVMQDRLNNLGMQEVELPEGSLRGHTFHHSRTECELEPLVEAVANRRHRPGEPVYRVNNLTASYLHLYFASNPATSARLFLPSDSLEITG